ncbi:MAG TPA: hypothetical protein PKK10_12320 [Woeseiaceae bacterium]|nr:hypothetical protein [Woeseiaceae bacterium]
MLFAHFLKRLRLLALLALLALSACGQRATEKRADNPDDPVIDTAALAARVTVSGVSAGGYMAVQSQVALADRISGAAAIAAGPYHCAAGSVATALGPCLKGAGIDVANLVDFARQNAAAGKIAPLTDLAGARAWVFQSPADVVVASGVGDAQVAFLRAFLPAENIAYVTAPEAGHGWPTLSNGVACGEMGGDFLNACDYDAAGELLRFLYPDLDAPRHDELALELRDVDVSAYFPSGNVADNAFAYVPADCAVSTENCRLHIAFHGCRQGAEFIGDSFARQAGLNEWADGNSIVVIYPQIEKSLMNPQGCWDWWGYTGADYDLASSAQVSGVRALIDAFARQSLL